MALDRLHHGRIHRLAGGARLPHRCTGGQVFKLDLVMAATVILCLLAALMYFLVVLLEKKLVKTNES